MDRSVWIEPAAIQAGAGLVETLGDPLLARILAARGIDDPATARRFTQPERLPKSDPRLFPGVSAAIERLTIAADRHETVLVWGDFDADGQTATALMVDALRRAEVDAHWHLPDRKRESHGLGIDPVDRTRSIGATLVITCDCGALDLRPIAALGAAGIDTIVTDHHAIPARVLERAHPARALVSPSLLPDHHPARHLAGVGTAYAVAAPFLAARGRSASDLVDLVALGTIADVAQLVDENRRLVATGLPALNRGSRPGIGALLSNSRRGSIDPLDSDTAAWYLAPRLNALGRLGDATPGVRLLLEDDPFTLNALAAQAEAANQRRQALCDEMVGEIERALETGDPPSDDDDERPIVLVADSAIVVARRGWHVGIIGLAAQRIAQSRLRPAVIVALDGERGRASMRAPEWCDLMVALAEVGEDPAIGFVGGGHKAAAGGSMAAGMVMRFAERFDTAARAQRPFAIQRIARPDVEIGLTDVTLEAARSVRRLAPFGRGNPEPLFLLRNVAIRESRRLGGDGRHLALTLASIGSTRTTSAMYWDGARNGDLPDRVDLLGTLERHEYNGSVRARLQIREARPATE